MKICFDNNVIIDIMLGDEFFEQSAISYDIVQLRGDEAYLPAGSLTDIEYVLHNRGLSRKQAKAKTDLLLGMFFLMDVTDSDAQLSRASDMPDSEDALIAFGAKRLNMDLIITRNLKDFALSPVATMSPEEFVRTFKPAGYQYEMVDLPEVPSAAD